MGKLMDRSIHIIGILQIILKLKRRESKIQHPSQEGVSEILAFMGAQRVTQAVILQYFISVAEFPILSHFLEPCLAFSELCAEP